MSPERPSSRRATSSASTPKPYVRTTSTTNREDNSVIAQMDLTQVDSIASKPGFPSYAQYKNIEANYLNSILPKRQCRALISQAMFDRIWYILQNPNSLAEDAQFRYWVRKMFTLGKFNDLSVAPDVLNHETSQAVILHEGRIVAVREQIYDIICYAHGITKHGGRDKTFSSIRKHYSWIPKELVGQFTKVCPSCLMKKCGFSKDIHTDANVGNRSKDDSALPTLRDFLHNLGKGTISEGGESDLPAMPCVPGPSKSVAFNSMSDQSTDEQPTRVPDASDSVPTTDHFLDRHANKSEPYEILMNPRAVPEPLRRAKTGLQSLPMSREVSLYQGLPNGWQFHTDYATAHAEFMKNQGDPAPPTSTVRENRPRIPSIAPMRSMYSESEDDTHRDPLPPLRSCNWDERHAGPPETLPSSMLPPHAPGPYSYVPQIDPALLAPPPFGDPPLSSRPGSGQDSPARVATNCGGSPAETPAEGSRSPNPRLQVTTSIRRPAIPPHINLQSLNSQKTIEAFLAHRATAGISPDSSGAYSTASPTSSVGSYSSRLSAFPMTATSSVSPANSVLPTPVDEVAWHKGDRLGKELADTAGGMHLNASVEAVCDGTA